MGCVLRVYGDDLEMEAQLPYIELIPVVTWKKGQERLVKGRIHLDSGANFVVSDADPENFSAQLADAEQYLIRHHVDILRLASSAGVTDALLDFAVATKPGFATQTSHFPVAFMERMSQLKLALAVSHYPTDHDSD